MAFEQSGPDGRDPGHASDTNAQAALGNYTVWRGTLRIVESASGCWFEHRSVITVPPADRPECSTVTFAVRAEGTADYQWRRKQTDLAELSRDWC